MQMCNYFSGGRKPPIFVGILPAVEWKSVREELGRARNHSVPKMTLGRLAKKTGLDRSTIHRIENVKKYPNHVPELDSIEKIADALELRLSLQIAHPPNTGLNPSRRSATKDGVHGSNQQGGTHDRLVPATPRTRRDLLVALTLALLDVIGDDLPVEARQQAATARLDAAKTPEGA